MDLGAGKQPSQTDVMAIVRIGDEIGILAVEAKVDETFGPTVDEWLKEAKGDTSSRQARLEHLCETLGLRASEMGPLPFRL